MLAWRFWRWVALLPFQWRGNTLSTSLGSWAELIQNSVWTVKFTTANRTPALHSHRTWLCVCVCVCVNCLHTIFICLCALHYTWVGVGSVHLSLDASYMQQVMNKQTCCHGPAKSNRNQSWARASSFQYWPILLAGYKTLHLASGLFVITS